MSRSIFTAALLAVPLVAGQSARSHPAVGIVQDRRGNVYFTDLSRVWKVTPDLRTSLAVEGVHSHELCLDAQDNLLGEHLWFQDGRWRHRVWRLKPDGTLNDIVPTREGFLSDDGFVRDAAGNSYWAERAATTVLKKRSPGGTITTHATGDLRAVQWMTATPDGTLYLMDGPALREVSPGGSVTTLVARLSSLVPPPPEASERNYHMGLWTDRKGEVHVAVAGERVILAVGKGGVARVVARSAAPWSSSGGMIDRDGNLWLLEYNVSNAVRARRIDRDGRERIFATSPAAR